MSTYRTRAADQRIADDVIADRTLACQANGCPNRWSVDAGKGRLCSAHAWADRHDWPRITQEQLDAETQRALATAAGPAAKPVRHFSQADKRQVLADLRRAFGQRTNPREWAHRLRDREMRGERLTQAQRDIWRSVLGAHGVLDAAMAGAQIPEPVITAALEATGDIPWAEREIPDFEPDGGDLSEQPA